jgi:hypothetical protein
MAHLMARLSQLVQVRTKRISYVELIYILTLSFLSLPVSHMCHQTPNHPPNIKWFLFFWGLVCRKEGGLSTHKPSFEVISVYFV